jgi:hypothetical protein
MVAYSLVQRLTPTTALIGAGALGTLAALVAALLPAALLESLVLGSGIAAFIPAAEPPLGFTARLCLGVTAGAGVALLSWFALTTLVDFARRRWATGERLPQVRRADAHPDAPPREPLRAGRDLGFEVAEAEPLELFEAELPPEPVIAMGTPTPALDLTRHEVAADPSPEPAPPPAVQPLPRDLDQPLAAFDPGAVPAVPLTAPRPVAPLRSTPSAPIYEAGERFETFSLTPAPAAAPQAAPITGPETVATVHSLLDRLERGIARRSQPPAPAPAPDPAPAQGLESTLEQLRRMAVRA